MHEQIERDVMRTHPDMHFFSGSDGAAVTHREVHKAHPGPLMGRHLTEAKQVYGMVANLLIFDEQETDQDLGVQWGHRDLEVVGWGEAAPDCWGAWPDPIDFVSSNSLFHIFWVCIRWQQKAVHVSSQHESNGLGGFRAAQGHGLWYISQTL